MKFTLKNMSPGQHLWRATGIKLSLFCESQWTGIIHYFQMNGKYKIDWAVCFLLYNQHGTAVRAWTCSTERTFPPLLYFLAESHFLTALNTLELWPLGFSHNGHNVLSYLLPPCSLHEVKSCISFYSKCCWLASTLESADHLALAQQRASIWTCH